MPFATDKMEISGAIVLASGLILGGAISIAGRHFHVSTPGLLSSRPEVRQVESALPPAPSVAGEPEAAEEPPEGAGFMGGLPSSGESAPMSSRMNVRGRRLEPIDLNRACAKDLEALDGVGPALAVRIVELRRSKGGSFRSMLELLEVRGIGPATLERIKASATLSPIEADHQNVTLRKSTSSQADSSSFQR